MGGETKLDRQYRAYLASDVWKCPAAPIDNQVPLQVECGTGAHYWLSRWFGDKLGQVFCCKYCYAIRRFEVDKKTERLPYF